ncbi:MAG: LPP20 family lipoprotein, partial [Thiovulaceae bacterium]|nr:LPP20 family lipoprotein [Sulfurimonadaceae bacterium]
MSKTLGSIALATLVTIGLTACGGGKPSFDECKEQGVDAPTWVCIPEVAGGVASVGSAQKSPAGTGFQRQEAMANGRDALARQISVKVKNMFKNFTQATGVG